MIQLSHICILIVAFFFLCSCDTALNKYAPVNDAEKDLVDVLDMYLKVRNAGDVKELASLFEEGGEYVSGDGSKFIAIEGIAQSDPTWWTQYGQQKILNPKFQIEDNKATISTTGKWGIQHRYPQTFTLVKHDGKWFFTRIAIE